MNARTLMLLGLLVVGSSDHLDAQPSWTNSTRIYTLIKGSQLVDDCPICDRPTIVVPMTGTFGLRFVRRDFLFANYEVQDISFHAGTPAGRQYQVAGSGTYRVGGEILIGQDAFLDVVINNGFTDTRALCVNTNRAVTQQWPEIGITMDQTNGTPAQLYQLTLVAVPALQFISISPDQKRGDVSVQWEGNAAQAQLELATNVTGPYFPLSPITTKSSFTDVGALTNRPQSFYRLRQY